VDKIRLAGLAEVAEILGVTKRTALRYTARTDFPEPLDRIAAGPVWRWEDVANWGAATLPLPQGWARGRARGAT